MKKLLLICLFFSHLASAKNPMAGAKLQPPLPANLWIEMARLQQPGVVGVHIDIDYKKVRMRRDPMFDMLEEFFGGGGFQFEDPRSDKESTPIGTGFIIDKQGHIVTNYHVIEPIYNPRLNTKLQVQINGQGKLLNVEVLGGDKRGDLALLKLVNPPKKFHVLQFGDSDKLKVGEYVAAFGNPYGHSNSMTVGVVSAKGRAIRELNRFPFIQTDASINPGNSGGPLLNTKGYVIGVNTAIDARAQGIGFAIPSNYAKKIVATIKAGKPIERGFLGIGMGTLHPLVARDYGIKSNGVVVTRVEPGFPAKAAGIQKNDIIIEFNGKSFRDTEDFVSRIQDTPVGTTVKIKVLRPMQNDFVEKTFDVTLTNYPGSAAIQKFQRPRRSAERTAPTKKSGKFQGLKAPHGLGFSVIDSSSGARREFNVPIRFPFGPIVTDVEFATPAAQGGFKQGYIVLRVNGNGTNSAEEVIKNLRPGVNRIWVHTPKGEKKISLKSP